MFPCQGSSDDSAKKLILILTDLPVLTYVGKDVFAGTFH